MTPVIREFQDADFDGVAALWLAAGVSRPWNDAGKDIAFARRDPHSTILVVEREGAVAATAMVGEDGHRGWLYYVAVDPRYRDLGLGRAIMEAAERWLSARGVWKVQLLVREENGAIRHFYEHLGYRDTLTICLQKVIGETAG